MQRLTYTNILGESVTFEGAPPFVFESIRGTGPTENLVTTIEGYNQDGDNTYSLRKRHRIIDLTFHIDGASRADMYAQRQKLSGVISKTKAFSQDTGARARLVYENDYGQWWTWAVPESGVSFDKRVRNFNYSVPVSFRCESPYWSAMAPGQTVLAYSGVGFTLPFQFPIQFGSREFAKTVENLGQVNTPVEITIEGDGETPAIVNHSTGAKILLTVPLPTGYSLYINTDPAWLAVTVTDPDGVQSNAFGYLDPATALTAFTLRPGQNDIEYLPGSTAAGSRITIRWYALYEGV